MQYACLEITLRRSAKSYNVKTVLWRSHYYVSIKFDFSLFFTIFFLFFNLSQTVFHLIKKVFDVSGLLVITSSLRFTSSESKGARNPVITVWVPLA